MLRSCSLGLIMLMASACGSTTAPPIEEPEESIDGTEPGGSAGRRELARATKDERDAGEADASPSASASKCAPKTSRQDCELCCEVSGDGRCGVDAGCATKPPADDCRTKGCGEGESCSKCWSSWACLAAGVKC